MTDELRIERIIDASAEEVFEAFVDPAAQEQWYRQADDWVVTSTCDLRVGGRWEVGFGPAGAEPYREINTFIEIDRPRRLVFAETFLHPDGTTSENMVAITFDERDGKTVLTIVHSGFADEDEREATRNGWPSFLERLEAYLARQRV